MINGLLMGQSNATSILARGGPAKFDSRLRVWNNIWNSYTGTKGTSWVWPDITAAPFDSQANNQGVHCADHLTKALNQEGRVIVVGRGGEGIDAWHNGSTTGYIYNFMIEVLAAAGQTQMDWFGWNQGSGDEGTYTTYATRFYALLSKMQTDGIITSTTPVFVSETAHAPNINGVLESMANSDARIGFVRMGHFPLAGDISHFNGNALAYAGYLSALEISKVNGPLKNAVTGSESYLNVTRGFAGSV
jgi:hypothetical protein